MKKNYKILPALIMGILCFVSHAVAIPNVITKYFQDTGTVTQVGTSNTWVSSWFGTFEVESDTSMWINHELHGRLEVSGDNAESATDWIYLEEDVDGWFWATRNHDGTNEVYPYLWTYATNEYFYFDETNSSLGHRKWYDSNWVLWTDDGSHIPQYDSGSWNNSFTIRAKNNCYSYACNVFQTSTNPPSPGPGWQTHTNFTSLLSGVIADGALTYSQLPVGPSNRGRIAIWYRAANQSFYLPLAPYWNSANSNCVFDSALSELDDCGDPDGYGVTVTPGFLWHFIREDRNGYWSQKPGWGSNYYVRNTDDEGYLMPFATSFSEVDQALDPYSYTEIQLYPTYGGTYYVITAPAQGQSTADVD